MCLFYRQEGMDTLGKEIEWLKRENARLKRYASNSIAASEEQLSSNLDEHHSWPNFLWSSLFKIVHSNVDEVERFNPLFSVYL